jgi:hypothetical protein
MCTCGTPGGNREKGEGAHPGERSNIVMRRRRTKTWSGRRTYEQVEVRTRAPQAPKDPVASICGHSNIGVSDEIKHLRATVKKIMPRPWRQMEDYGSSTSSLLVFCRIDNLFSGSSGLELSKIDNLMRLSSFGLLGTSCMALPTARNYLLRQGIMSSFKRHAIVRAAETNKQDEFDIVQALETSKQDDFEVTTSSNFDYAGKHKYSDGALTSSSTINCKKAPQNEAMIPPNFGAPGGTAVANKGSILRDIDNVLSEGRPPDLEVLLADHLCYTGNALCQGLHISLLRYGHVAVRYTKVAILLPPVFCRLVQFNFFFLCFD